MLRSMTGHRSVSQCVSDFYAGMLFNSFSLKIAFEETSLSGWGEVPVLDKCR